MKKLVIILGIALALFWGYVAIQPADYLIARETVINAPVEKVFPYLNSVKEGDKWGPWREIDPAAAMTYSGPEVGVGSKEAWVSKTELGTGSATIVQSVLNQSVVIKLEYTAPMSMTQESTYLTERVGEGDQTRVVWKVTGKNNFIGRLFCMFMNMDNRVGGMFERGLANLKSIVETGAK